MTAINEITAKMDHVLFTCNWFIVLRKWAHTCMLLQKSCFENISKFQQILTTAMESISRKGSFLQLLNVLWKRTLPQLFFYIATLIGSKLQKFPVHRNSFSIYWSGEIFPLLNDLMVRKFMQMREEECSCAASLHHIKKCSVRFVQEVVQYVWKID